MSSFPQARRHVARSRALSPRADWTVRSQLYSRPAPIPGRELFTAHIFPSLFRRHSSSGRFSLEAFVPPGVALKRAPSDAFRGSSPSGRRGILSCGAQESRGRCIARDCSRAGAHGSMISSLRATRNCVVRLLGYCSKRLPGTSILGGARAARAVKLFPMSESRISFYRLFAELNHCFRGERPESSATIAWARGFILFAASSTRAFSHKDCAIARA